MCVLHPVSLVLEAIVGIECELVKSVNCSRTLTPLRYNYKQLVPLPLSCFKVLGKDYSIVLLFLGVLGLESSFYILAPFKRAVGKISLIQIANCRAR